METIINRIFAQSISPLQDIRTIIEIKQEEINTLKGLKDPLPFIKGTIASLQIDVNELKSYL